MLNGVYFSNFLMNILKTLVPKAYLILIIEALIQYGHNINNIAEFVKVVTDRNGIPLAIINQLQVHWIWIKNLAINII